MASGIASLSLDQLSIDTLAPARRGRGGKGQQRPSGSAAGLRADCLSAVSQADEAQSGALEVGRPGPVCAVERPRVDAALRDAVSHRLQADAGRFEELSAVGIEDAGASGVRTDRRRGGDDRAAGAGIRDGRGHGHGGEAPGGDLQPARLRRGGSPHVCAVRRRRSDGGPVARGGIAGRNAGAGQADRSLRRQSDLARRAHELELYRRMCTSASRPTTGMCSG